MEWLPIIKELGPYLGIMFFFIWRDYKREELLVQRNNELNDFIRNELLDLITNTNRIMEDARKPEPNQNNTVSTVPTETRPGCASISVSVDGIRDGL